MYSLRNISQPYTHTQGWKWEQIWVDAIYGVPKFCIL